MSRQQPFGILQLYWSLRVPNAPEAVSVHRRNIQLHCLYAKYLEGDEVVLSYSMPLLPEKVAIEKEGVLPTVQYGGRYWT